ncbi:MAG: Bug family tripartite tricarboxylate transporter substrate binding protein [Candidatus Binatia bacterium]
MPFADTRESEKAEIGSDGHGQGGFMKSRFALLVALLITALLSNALPVSSAPVQFEGKVITIVVGYAPGGGYDRMARLLAKHLPKHIPGKPAITVENRPGASSMIAANHVFNRAQPDGLTIGTFNRGLPFAQITKLEGMRLDLRKFSWIGSAAVESSVFAIRSDLPYKSYNDVRNLKEPLNLGGTGPASSSHQFPLILTAYLNLNARIITYPSNADVFLGIERKELDGLGATYSSITPLVERGVVRPLIRGRAVEPGIEQLPVNEDLTTDKRGKTIMAMLNAADEIGRPFVAPPATSPEIMGILREAFAKAARDPELKAEAAKVKMSVEYVPANRTVEILNFLLEQPPDVVKEFSKYVKF